jgi:hypothetical protein
MEGLPKPASRQVASVSTIRKAGSCSCDDVGIKTSWWTTHDKDEGCRGRRISNKVDSTLAFPTPVPAGFTHFTSKLSYDANKSFRHALTHFNLWPREAFSHLGEKVFSYGWRVVL